MAVKTVEFRFMTGLKRRMFRNARLHGSWGHNGRYSELWTEYPMAESIGEDGCPAFTAALQFDSAESDKIFKWGVVVDGPQGANFWGIPTEVNDVNSMDRYRQFRLMPWIPDPQVETYYFTYYRRLGANKHFTPGNPEPGIRFAVWAPNAKSVDVVFGFPESGYIYDDGKGIDTSRPNIPLVKQSDGIWQSEPQPDFASFEGLPYMYRIVNAQGKSIYRTDIFSRSQIGTGDINPEYGLWNGKADTLSGTKSCSLVVDPDRVARHFEEHPGAPVTLDFAADFWQNEFEGGLPRPARFEDLVIYELHVGSLGYGKPSLGTLADAIQFLDHLTALGINAVELMPMAEYSEIISWGYGDTHHLCIESSSGGRDQYRHFVRECHRRGIAVIQDVVYNHYDHDAGRAEWQYDSEAPEQNIYYWYEGLPSDYPGRPDGGYLNNNSSGWAPRFWEDVVRQQFISAAAFLVEEMHVDGLRVDLTQAIHRDNSLNFDGRSIGSANIFGQKFLREWSRTLRMIRPSVILIAEDHTGWDAVTKPPAAGGLGFDATWFARFSHGLVGDSDMAGGEARLLKIAGYGRDEPLDMDRFAEVLYDSRLNKIVYHKTHDECGNAAGTARTMVTAVNRAPILDSTRFYAEARSRLAFGLSLFSAGTPMFFMGEEIAAQKYYTYSNVLTSREDILGGASGVGAHMFRFYQDVITLSSRLRSVRSQNMDILHRHNANRVIVFKRWNGEEQVIVFASLNNSAFEQGYVVQKDLLAIPNAYWKEIFNSDAGIFGGVNVGNSGGIIQSSDGRIDVIIPANGFVVLVKQ
jgi:1,4-alpha-glucan branching enzyme